MKQIKYWVVSKKELLKIIEHLDREQEDQEYKVAVLHLERAGKKFPGQVRLTDKDKRVMVYGWTEEDAVYDEVVA
jgi:hypothetical protein